MMKAAITRFAAAVLLVCMATACSTDAVLGFANTVMTSTGDKTLTGDGDLMGHRRFAEDSFTGTLDLTISDPEA